MVRHIFRILLFLVLASYGHVSYGQDDDSAPSPFSLKGYVKDVRTFTIIPDSLLVDNLLHNRINLQWFPLENVTVTAELRNRLFYGDMVRSFPQYSQFIDVNNDYFDFSFTPIDNTSLVLHSMLDRLYLEWLQNDVEVRIGRQRVNWGVTMVWNPNDVFNAYSFFDFDYEERPGSDAVRVRYYTGVASSVEIAIKAARHIRELVAAGLWRVNTWNYDIQLLAGVAHGDVTLGGGWAGNIGDAGFKGEATYFLPYDGGDGKALVGTLAADYSFPSSLYFQGAVLYNSAGAANPSLLQLAGTAVGRLTAKQLSPYRVSAFLQTSYTFHPLLSGSAAIMYFPENNGAFISPTLTVSLAENFDLDAIAQLFFAKQGSAYTAQSKQLFARLKWSF